MPDLVLHFERGSEKKEYKVAFSWFKIGKLSEDLEKLIKEGWVFKDATGNKVCTEFLKKTLLEKHDEK